MPTVVLASCTGGEPGEKVASRAAEIARERKGKLVLAHIVDEDFLRTLPGAFGRPEAATKSMEITGAHLLEEIAGKLGKGARPQLIVRRGPLARELREIAKEVGATVLVVGEHKRHFLETHHGHDFGQLKREAGLELVVVK